MIDSRLTIFDVLDNYLGSDECPDVSILSDQDILELRQHVVDFSKAYTIPECDEYETRLYLGGFLSSPPLSLQSSPYLASAILHADSIVLYEPLHYWFCDEQYRRRRLESAPQGWLDTRTRRPSINLTRQYLQPTLRSLYELRPLVDSGIIVLIPAEQIVCHHAARIAKLKNGITELLGPAEGLVSEFAPEDITVDDNRKGLFVFKDGERTIQLERSISHGVGQFTKDIVVGNATNSVYTAPFRWEQHLGRVSLDRFSAPQYHSKVVEGIRQLRLPILSNLTPEVVLRLHRDSQYTEFRAELREAIRSINAEIGSDDFEYQVSQIERDFLLPRVDAIQEGIESSDFRAATSAVKEGLFTFVQTYIGNWATELDPVMNAKASALTAAISFVYKSWEEIRRKRGSRIWAHLVPEKPSSSIYGSPAILKRQGETGWDIGEAFTPGIVKVSKGVYKLPAFLFSDDREESAANS